MSQPAQPEYTHTFERVVDIKDAKSIKLEVTDDKATIAYHEKLESKK